MDEENDVQDPVVEEETVNEEEATEEEKKVLIDDPNDPLKNKEQIEGMLKNAEMLVSIMEQQFTSGAAELGIKDEHIQELTKWNDAHKKEMPADLTDEEKEKWDHWNGLDCITEEELERIFGKEHQVYGLSHEATIDRIKGVCSDFLSWLTAMREYRNIHDAYMQLLELEEEKQIVELKRAAETETDEGKKKQMLDAIDNYYYNKYLGFLADPLDDKARDRLLGALKEPRKLDYWIQRTRDKLDQLDISQKFILEISQFEKRFMDETYLKNNNMLLLWFLNECAFCNAGDKKSASRTKIVCMVMGLDAVIRKTWPQERIDRVMANVKAFEDQFLPYTKEAEPSEHIIAPPITEEISNK